MRKIFFILLSYFLLLNSFLSFLTPKKALAAGCQITQVTPITINLDDGFRIPIQIKAGEQFVDLDIKTSGLVADGKTEYWIKLNDNFISQESAPFAMSWMGPKSPLKFKVSSDGTIAINHVNQGGVTQPEFYDQQKFEAKTYAVSISGPNKKTDKLCSGNFTVGKATVSTPGMDKCAIDLTTNSDFTATSKDDVLLTLLKPNIDETKLDIVVKAGGEGGTDRKTWNSIPISELTGNVKSLGLFETGSYYVAVGRGLQNLWGVGTEKFCSTKFSICPDCKINVFQFIGSSLSPPLPCAEGKRSDAEGCKEVNTAVGPIPTSPAGLVSFLFKLILGLSGGIALILIIVGAYQMMTSQGNPERLQGAKETITSAIVGLLFIIFSFLLLEIIGVDILRIPGLER